MGLQFDRSLYHAYERSLYAFTLEPPVPSPGTSSTRRNTGCTPRKLCLSTIGSFGIMFILMGIAIITLHSKYVNEPNNCLNNLLEDASRYWANETSIQFFRADDILRIKLDWEGTTGGYGSIVYSVTNSPSQQHVLSSTLQAPWPPGGIVMDDYTPDYIFSFIPSLVTLDMYANPSININTDNGIPSVIDYSSSSTIVSTGSLSQLHNFRRFNITLPVYNCKSIVSSFTTNTNFLEKFVLGYFISYDTVIINQLMWSFSNGNIISGYIKNTYTNEDWGWPVPQTMKSGIITGSGIILADRTKDRNELNFWGFLFRIIAFIEIIVSFFFLSSISALFIRTLLTSGVVLVYPLAYCMRWIVPSSAAVRESERAINQAYPWLGGHVRQLRLLNESVVPFISSHIQQLILIFTLHQASQYTLSLFFYQWKSIPAELNFSMWLLFLLIEYFSMMYARTQATITVFSKGMLLGYIVWGTYFYAVPYGFFSEMTTLYFLLCLILMFTCLLYYEVPALRSGRISYEKPRELFVRLATPELVGLQGTLPPLWSLWHPVNFYVPHTDIYSNPVPSLASTMNIVNNNNNGADGSSNINLTHGTSSPQQHTDMNGDIYVAVQDNNTSNSNNESNSSSGSRTAFVPPHRSGSNGNNGSTSTTTAVNARSTEENSLSLRGISIHSNNISNGSSMRGNSSLHSQDTLVTTGEEPLLRDTALGRNS